MKPHPRIRKTITWGGLAACILLAGLWAASERWWMYWYQKPWLVTLYRESARVEYSPAIMYRMPPGWCVVVNAAGAPREWWVRWDHGVGMTRLVVPFWMPLTLAAAGTATAWLLDARARRRERAGKCAKCGYDRAGLAPEAVCPECGTATMTA